MVHKRLHYCLLAFATCLMIPTSILASDWPEFRGPTQNGLSTETDLPVQWNTEKNIAWQQAIPGSGWSSPVVVDGRVYLTTATGTIEENNVVLHALCLDATDGHTLWDSELFQPKKETIGELHGKNSLASPTPIVAGSKLFVHFGHMGTAALDLDGKVLWKTAVVFQARHGNGGSPTLVDDTLIFNCDGTDEQFVAALDASTGELKWKHPRGSAVQYPFSFCTPQLIEVDGERQVISPGSGFVGAYDPRDGRELWRVEYGEGHSVIPRPVFAHGLVYISSGFIRANLLAIDPHAAKGDVTASHVTWQYDQGVPTIPSLLVVGDEIYFVSEKGVATCLDAHSGKVHWTERLGGNFSSSPISAEGRIYFVNEDATTFVVRAATTYELLETNELGGFVQASPAVADGAIFLRTDKHLWRIGKELNR